MRCTLVLEFDAKDAQPRRVELLHLHRNAESPTEGDIGLTLAEAKTVLLSIQQEVVAEQLARYCVARRSCSCCNAVRKLHDSRCSELRTVLGRVSYVRERWKACDCGADDMQYISPLKTYLLATHTAELKWLHAKLGAMLPYRQALEVLGLLLPSSGRDSHVTIRNHTIEVGQAIRSSNPPHDASRNRKPIAELGIDVGYARKAKPRSGDSQRDTGAISIVVAAVGPKGRRPRIWASAQPRATKLHAEMIKFLASSGYGSGAKVQVITDAAKDLADVSDKLPHDSRWMLDWAHIGRNCGCSIVPSPRLHMDALPRTDRPSNSGISSCGFAAMSGRVRLTSGSSPVSCFTNSWSCVNAWTPRAWPSAPVKPAIGSAMPSYISRRTSSL